MAVSHALWVVTFGECYMVKHIKFWKLCIRNGTIKAVALYKDSDGRKRVAIASDGTDEGKKELAKMMVADYTQKRMYGEISGASLSFLSRNIDVSKYVIPYHKVEAEFAKKGESIYPVPDSDQELKRHPTLKDGFYQREIGGQMHTKIMLGKIGVDIY